jgi:PhzF family phenazine biosynthesis protein
VLWKERGAPKEKPLLCHTKSGVLTCTLSGGRIQMDFPAKPPVETPAPPDLARALGLEPREVLRNAFDYLVLVESEDALRRLRPDFAALAKLPVRGAIVTARAATSGFDFVSRFFAPASGVDEDPVTGSAHCCLAPYWAARLGKTEMAGLQVSERGGIVHTRLAGDRVFLSGDAVTVWRGEVVAGP